MSARPTCPNHPGLIRPCERCEPEARAALRAQQQQQQEASMAVQQSLTGYMWEQYEVPVVKVSVSGSQNMPMDILSALDLQDLEPGDAVILTIGCVVRRVALDDEDGKKRGLVGFKLGMVRGAQVVRETDSE